MLPPDHYPLPYYSIFALEPSLVDLYSFLHMKCADSTPRFAVAPKLASMRLKERFKQLALPLNAKRKNYVYYIFAIAAASKGRRHD